MTPQASSQKKHGIINALDEVAAHPPKEGDQNLKFYEKSRR